MRKLKVSGARVAMLAAAGITVAVSAVPAGAAAAPVHTAKANASVTAVQCREEGGEVRWQSTGGDTARLTCQGGIYNGYDVSLLG